MLLVQVLAWYRQLLFRMPVNGQHGQTLKGLQRIAIALYVTAFKSSGVPSWHVSCRCLALLLVYPVCVCQ